MPIVLPEEKVKPRDVPPSSDSNNNSIVNSGSSTRASVLIAASASYSPNAIAIYSSNPADTTLYSANGQGFTASVTAYVTSAMFRMIPQTNVSLTASFVARIYAASGGSPNLPTGSPLATSAAVTWEEIRSMSNAGNIEIPFTFDGTFQVQQGTNYYVCVAAISGPLDTTNYMWTYYSAVNTALNSVRFRNNVWSNNSSTNLYFSVIGSTSSGGGSTPDWNNVPFIHLKENMYLDAVATAPSDPMQFIEILSDPAKLTTWEEIIQFMRQGASGSWNYNDPNSAALKFTSNIDSKLTTSLFQVNFTLGGIGTGITCSHHFIVRKDLFLNGMLNSIEGAIVLHAGEYRQWLGSYQNPTIYSSEEGYHVVDFREFLSPSPFIPIRVGGVYTSWLEKLPGINEITLKSPLKLNTLLDGNGNSGTSGQVLTSTGGTAPTWQTPSGGAGGVQKGTATTNATTGQVTVPLTTALPSGTLPFVTCTPIDSTGRTISLVITNRTNTNFTVRASIADSVNHQHKIGHAYATVTNPITIASENNHTHTYATYTDYQDVNHNHSIASVGDHTHGITHSNSTMNTGPTTVAGVSHTHTYTEYFVNNNVTNSGGGHTHGTGGNTGSTSINHRHSVAGTTGTTSHTHTFSQMPTYMRETVLRLQNGTAHSIGSTLTMYQDTAVSTDLYTENAGGSSGSSLGTPVGVTFCWLAV